jgi:hypothetical protein
MFCTLLGKNEMGMSCRVGEHIGIKGYPTLRHLFTISPAFLIAKPIQSYKTSIYNEILKEQLTIN